jgi:hypothetical protein
VLHAGEAEAGGIGGGDAPDTVGAGGTVVELNAAFDGGDVAGGGGAAAEGEVFLFDFEARMGQAEGEVAVVGEEEEAGGVAVEAADGLDGGGRVGRQEFEDEAFGEAVGAGDVVAAGFVEEVVKEVDGKADAPSRRP